MALTSRPPRPGVIHHSDRGMQYLSASYTNNASTVARISSAARP
jgi:transposase InsO family protein